MNGEAFTIIFPPHAASRPVGVLVWVSHDDEGAPPVEAWREVLARRRIVWAGLNGAGNHVDGRERARRAIEALIKIDRVPALRVDADRWYVGGFSGGARVASLAAMEYAHSFKGAVLAGGVGYFRDVPVKADGQVLRAVFEEPPKWGYARHNRFALVVGAEDEWRNPALAVAERMRRDDFEHVAAFEVPDLGHEPPPAEWFDKAMEFIDGGNT